MSTDRILFFALAALSAGIRATNAGPATSVAATNAERALKSAATAIRATEFDLETIREARRGNANDLVVHVRPLAQSALWRARIVLEQVETALATVRHRLEEASVPEAAARVPDAERPGRTMADRIDADLKALGEARRSLVMAIAEAVRDASKDPSAREVWIEKIDAQRRQVRLAEHSLFGSRAIVERQGDLRRDLGRFEVQLNEARERRNEMVYGPPPFSPPRAPGLSEIVAEIDRRLKGRGERGIASPGGPTLRTRASAY